jgi:hypothetical protein
MPNTRGTLAILFSCSTTLALCVWTGVHLNVEGDSRKRLIQFIPGRKIIWAVIALLAPDIVLTIALHQFLTARQYLNIVNTKNSGKNQQPLHLKAVYFALMGGFSSKILPEAEEYIKKDALSAVNHLCQPKVMDKIRKYPLSENKERSKSGGLEKVLAIFQTGWILLQCFGRQLEGLHVSLLELNTAVHVLIAIATYVLWWEKPVNINESIEIAREKNACRSPESINYVDSLRHAFDRADAEISPRIMGLASSKTVPKTLDEKPKDHREMVAATAVLRSITNALTKPSLLRRFSLLGGYLQMLILL